MKSWIWEGDSRNDTAKAWMWKPKGHFWEGPNHSACENVRMEGAAAGRESWLDCDKA